MKVWIQEKDLVPGERDEVDQVVSPRGFEVHTFRIEDSLLDSGYFQIILPNDWCLIEI